MKQWISRVFLLTGLVLLLFHNLAAHHHDDEVQEPVHHHDDEHDALEHVKIDHVFYTDHIYTSSLLAIIPELIYKPDLKDLQFPTILYNAPAILPQEPYPPAWVTNKTILRGPPSNC
jgi:hypothetical protein